MSSQPGTLWIGDLDPYIDEAFLKQSFLLMGEILRQAKIIRNKYNGSKLGYGFLEFGDEATARRVLNRCNGKVIPNSNGSKRFKLNYANQGKDSGSSSSRSSMPAVPGQDYQQCYQYPAYDYQSYYAAWQNYQNPYYNYNYDQNYAASYDTSRYQQSQSQQTQPPQQQQQQPQQQQQSSSSQQPVQTQQASQYYNSTYDASDNLIEEHDIPPDVEQLNEEIMNRNEELYAALENSRWLPTEDLVPPLIKIK